MTIRGGHVLDLRIPSHSCAVADLIDDAFAVADGDLAGVVQDRGWAGRWTVTRKNAGEDAVCTVAELERVDFVGSAPVRRFTWRTEQRHRPGLQFMVSTGRHHGFESIAEQKTLLALDFAGQVQEVWSQPFRLRFATGAGWWQHTPDFLVRGRGGHLVVDVRPGGRIEADDRVRFAATAQMALACGWGYVVATGWRAQVMGVLDTLSSQRRAFGEHGRLRAQLLQALVQGPVPFGDLAAATDLVPVARALILHLLWHRRLSIDLSRPLTDRSLVFGSGW